MPTSLCSLPQRTLCTETERLYKASTTLVCRSSSTRPSGATPGACDGPQMHPQQYSDSTSNRRSQKRLVDFCGFQSLGKTSSSEPWSQFTDTSGVFEKPIEGFPGYFVRRNGTVRMRRKRENGVRISLGRENTHGYKQVKLTRDGKPHLLLVSRLVALAFVKNPRPDIFTQVDHINQNITDNAAVNLRWLSRSLNLMWKTCRCVLKRKGRKKTFYTNVKGMKKKFFYHEADAVEHAKHLKRKRFLKLYTEAISTSPSTIE